MKNPDLTTRISKHLSFVLRHLPESIGITLDAHGWTDIATLIRQMNAHGTALDRALLDHIVATNPKQRFAYGAGGSKIRANQGHSIAIDLAYSPAIPPETLYHGTAQTTLAAIRQSGGLDKRTRHHVHLSPDAATAHKVGQRHGKGLIAGSRHHVHLSADIPAAQKVGQRHGKPIVLRIHAAAMHAAGHAFYLSDNQVWLTDHVPLAYIAFDN
mgnify:CR=1 FL=1